MTFKHTGEKNLFYINAFLDRLPVFAPVTLTANDSLLFGFIKGAIESDTSWNLMMIKSDTTITARYTQILPSFVSGFDGYIDDSSKLLYYDGFTFEINKNEWSQIIHSSGIENYIAKDSLLYTGCLHCPRYTAYYNSKLIISSKLDADFLFRLDGFLQREIIDELFEKKSKPRILFENKSKMSK